MTAMYRLTVRLDNELEDRLRDYAKITRRALNDIVTQFVADGLDEAERVHQLREAGIR